ncbi:MAG: uroporphyrinogen decarboxylase family protein [Christensenellales bacterium]|jgi:uroporphyrinogen decarboxylase
MKFDDGLDLEQFWKDDDIAQQNNCFNDGTKVSLGIRMNTECIFDELGIEVAHPWDEPAPEDMHKWRRMYNDKAEMVVGRRLLQEDCPPADARHPYVKRIGEAFGGEYVFTNYTEWLEKGANDYKSLEKILDRVETMDYRQFMLPENWESEKKRISETYGTKPPLLRHIRGPVTLACSIFGVEDLIFLIMDEPDLARRFSEAITHAILEMARITDEEAGETPQSAPGFSFADDNCCLLSPEMYEFFGYPVLKAVFERYSPLPEHKRFQHSDSDMGHLLPILGRLNLNGVNFGPNVLVPQIRKHLPKARIDGCIAPFTFSRNDREELYRQTKRDCLDGMRYGGVNISTAGSINYGSSLESLRLIMATIQEYGRK